MSTFQWILLLVVIWSQSVPLLCRGQCDTMGFLVCNIRVVNMTSDGGIRMRRAIDDDANYYTAINIEKLIVSVTASGPFLLRIGAYTDAVSYVQYRDAVFQLPEGSTLSEIYIGGSGTLRSFTSGLNSGLRKLTIDNCLLDRVPPTLGKMVNLLHLSINRCLLTGLKLDVLAENRELLSIDLSSNRIRQLFPMTTAVRASPLAVTDVSLVANQLERLDMFVFGSMPLLERIDLRFNRIVHLEASSSVTFPYLSRLHVASNKIASVDWARLTLLNVNSLLLDENALTDIPIHLGTIPNLRLLSLEQNNLKRLNLTSLRPMQTLRGLYLKDNQIESVRATASFRMPHLDVLELTGNRINSFNLTGCDFPNITLISLTYNLLTAVPPLFQRYPRAVLLLDGNPIKCSTLAPFNSRLVERRLFMGNIWMDTECPTTSSIPVDENEKACCDG